MFSVCKSSYLPNIKADGLVFSVYFKTIWGGKLECGTTAYSTKKMVFSKKKKIALHPQKKKKIARGDEAGESSHHAPEE